MVLDLEGKVVVASDDLPSRSQCKPALKTKNWKKLWKAMLALGLQGDWAQENQEILWRNDGYSRELYQVGP